MHWLEMVWHLFAHVHALTPPPGIVRICHGPIVSGLNPGHPVTVIPPACTLIH